MRFLAIFILLVFVLAGIAFGALNAGWVDYDLGLAEVRVPKGASLLAAVALGWALGGLTAWAGAAFRRRRRRAGRADQT